MYCHVYDDLSELIWEVEGRVVAELGRVRVIWKVQGMGIGPIAHVESAMRGARRVEVGAAFLFEREPVE
jgi:hypothetical protein